MLGVSITSPRQQENLPCGGKERGLSKMTLGFVPPRTAGKGVTEGGAKLVATFGEDLDGQEDHRSPRMD